MTRDRPKVWVHWLPLAEWWFITTYHSATQMTPYQIVYSQGPLYLYIHYIPSFSIITAVDLTSGDIIAQGMWRWPRLRSPLIQAIIAQTPPSLRPNSEVEDYVLWLPHPSGNFTAKSSWNPLRDRYPIQPWHIIIWRNNVPRWSFVLWLAVLRRLSTKDRLKARGMQIDGVCCLCNFEEETQECFFF